MTVLACLHLSFPFVYDKNGFGQSLVVYNKSDRNSISNKAQRTTKRVLIELFHAQFKLSTFVGRTNSKTASEMIRNTDMGISQG